MFSRQACPFGSVDLLTDTPQLFQWVTLVFVKRVTPCIDQDTPVDYWCVNYSGGGFKLYNELKA